jgi:Uncharacterized conserved protein (DUF2304)
LPRNRRGGRRARVALTGSGRALPPVGGAKLGRTSSSFWYEPLRWVSYAIGAAADSSTLFLFGLAFALLTLLHFSARISGLERQPTALVQEIGLLRVREPPNDESASHSDRERVSA